MKNKKNVSALYKILEFMGIYIMMYLAFVVFFTVGLSVLVNGLGFMEAIEEQGGFGQILNEYVIWYNLFIPLGLTFFGMNVCFGKDATSKVDSKTLAELKELMPKLWIFIVFVGMALLDITTSLGISLVTLLFSGNLCKLVIMYRLNKYKS